MLVRVIDLSLKVAPSVPTQTTFPPELPTYEPIAAERPRLHLQGLCRLEPYRLSGSSDDVCVDITIGHSTPHTHVDVFLHDWDTLHDPIGPRDLWAVRDNATIPEDEHAGFAAVVDVSDYGDEGSYIPLPLFRERAAHVRPGDIVLVKTGHPERYGRSGKKSLNLNNVPLISREIAQWLVHERHIRVYGHDAVVNGNFRLWMHCEQVFYRNGVLMIDRMRNLEKLEGGGRIFVNVGIGTRLIGADDGPARVVAFDREDPPEASRATNLFSPVQSDMSAIEDAPHFPRTEPLDLKDEILRRYRITPVHISMREYDVEKRGFLSFKTYNNRVGTHLELPSWPLAGQDIPESKRWNLGGEAPDTLWGPAAVIDAWAVGPQQNVSTTLLEAKGRHIKVGDIVMLRTSYADSYYHSGHYWARRPGFDEKAIAWLISKQVKILVVDMPSVEAAGAGAGNPKVNLAALHVAGIPVVLSATGMWRLRQERPVAFVSPVSIVGINAVPCGMMVAESYR